MERRSIEVQALEPAPLFFERLFVPSAASRKVQRGQGLLCAAVPHRQDLPGLLLVEDELCNEGAAGTNVLGLVLSHLRTQWGATLLFEELNVIQRDSLGCYDHVHVTWRSAWHASVDWTAVRWPGATPRSEQAFLGMFSAQAERVLETVRPWRRA